MSRACRHLVCLIGCFVLSVADLSTAQFAQVAVAATATEANQTTSASQAQPPSWTIQPGIQLPECPNQRVLSTIGVPDRWGVMSIEEQVAHPINAIALQLAYIPWQDDPKATLGSCLDNLGIVLDSMTTVHKVVLPYLGTMTAVVMRAGNKGVFVSFRGTDFDDPGDVLVDADCQYTDNKGSMFGSKQDIRLHTGFYRAWESVAPVVIPAVWKQLQQTETKKVYLIGHSLGGSMASIAALRMHYLLKQTRTGAEVGGVWLFGCPRVGNEEWAAEYNRRLLHKTLRMANFGDFASRLPMQTQFCPSAARLLSNFQFRHVGRSLVLCPDSTTGLTDWHLYANGSEALNCGNDRPDAPDFTVTTHWLGPYLDAWRRAHAAALGIKLASDPLIASVICEACSLSFPNDRAKQLNVPARAGGPIGCCTSASCSQQSAWDAVVAIKAQVIRSFNPASVCRGYICT